VATIADLPSGWTRLRDSTRWRLAGGVIQAEATWWGPGETYAEFLKAVGGLTQSITYPGPIVVNRIVPLKFPSDSADFANVYAIDCDIEGAGLPRPSNTEEIVYEWARARVVFQSDVFWQFGGDFPLISYSFSGGADFTTRPGTAYRFPSDGLRLNQDVGVLVPWRDFQITQHMLTTVNESQFDSLTGRVNSVGFNHPNGIVYPAGTIQYLGPAGQFQRTIGNQVNWSVTHRFKLRYIKHNEIMRPDGSGFEAPEDDNGDQIIPSANLNLIYGA
jgi:hypothetical protein